MHEWAANAWRASRAKLRSWALGVRPNLLTKAAAEFSGCMLFHFLGSSMPTPAANAAALTVLVYYTAKLSGGHLNPALTATFALLGYTNPVEVVVYWASQVAGCIAGALLVAALSSDLSVGDPVVSSGSGCFVPLAKLSGVQVMGWEALCTFSFILPIFSVVWYTQCKNGYGNTGPIIVGLSLYAAASAAAPWTGGALNPARAVASSIVFDCGPGTRLGCYVAGQFIGASLVPIAVMPWYGIAYDYEASTAEAVGGSEVDGGPSLRSSPVGATPRGDGFTSVSMPDRSTVTRSQVSAATLARVTSPMYVCRPIRAERVEMHRHSIVDDADDGSSARSPSFSHARRDTPSDERPALRQERGFNESMCVSMPNDRNTPSPAPSREAGQYGMRSQASAGLCTRVSGVLANIPSPRLEPMYACRSIRSLLSELPRSRLVDDGSNQASTATETR